MRRCFRRAHATLAMSTWKELLVAVPVKDTANNLSYQVRKK